MNIDEDTGCWKTADPQSREGTYDEGLSRGLLSFFKGEKARTVADMGCGWAPYTKHFCANDLFCQGFDGNIHTPENTEEYGRVLDLSKPVRFKPRYDWVLSLEVGEHIPKQHEETFINNLHENNTFGIVMSWAVKGQEGDGHVNTQNNDYIKKKFLKLGYRNDLEQELGLRKVSKIWWFKNTIMVFRK